MNSIQDSEFNRLLPVETQQYIFKFLPLWEQISKVGLVCSEWRAAQISMLNIQVKTLTFAELTMKDITQKEDVEEDRETTGFINTQWKRFEKAIQDSSYSDSKKIRILTEARKAFEAGIVALYAKYDSDLQKNQYSSFYLWITKWCFHKQPNVTLFKMLLTCEGASKYLSEANAQEIKELFVTYNDKDSTLLTPAVIFDWTTAQNDTKFLQYLIKTKPELLQNEESLFYLCLRCRLNENLALLKTCLDEKFKQSGISAKEKEKILAAMEKANSKESCEAINTTDFFAPRHPPLSTKEIQQHIAKLRGEEKDGTCVLQ